MCELGGTQTHDLQNRNLTLYSTKLRVLHLYSYYLYREEKRCKFTTFVEINQIKENV